MMKLGTYAAASVVATAAVIYNAFLSRKQFYPAMLYLSTSKINLVLLLNMAFVVLYALWQLIKLVFLGSLREAEVERLNEQLWRELMEVLFAMTIFREEFNVSFVAMVTVLLFVKAFHWLAQKRVEYIEITPSISRVSHLRISAFMFFLLILDSVFVHSSVWHLVRTKKASVSLFFAFEYIILATSVIAMFLKYTLYMGDMWMEGQWDNKAVYIFYLELIRDLLHLSLYLFFFLVIFINYGLPLHLVRELYEIIRNFKARVSDFIRYRKVTSNMNERFPDATGAELSRSDATCIICREEMTVAKKLPCGHLFHVHCLRSWLERQQTCPTCRSPVIPPEAAEPTAAQRLSEQREGQPGVPTDGSAPPAGPVSAAQAQQARLQAATAAAAQYGSSFVYPASNSANLNWYPMYVPMVPQQSLSKQPASNGPEGKTTENASSSTEAGGSSSKDPVQEQPSSSSSQQRLMTPAGQVYFMPVIPGSCWSAQPKTDENKSAATNSSNHQNALQKKYLDSTIQLLRQQLNAALELQQKIAQEHHQHQQQEQEEQSVDRDRKGKAPAENGEGGASSSAEQQTASA